MKNKTKIITTVAFGVLGLSISVVPFFQNEKVAETSGYDANNGNLPTTIDLNDSTESEIRSYYSDLNALDNSERKGTNLLKNLKPILKDGQVYYKYDGASLWSMYEIIDRDWVKSPADQIPSGYGTYNSTTNKISNYVYGTSVAKDKGSNPYIHALYVNRNVDNQTTAWSDHDQTQWGINQEHIWPKSQGFNASGAGGARGDPMHLWAGNGRVNGTEHNNHPYGYVNKSKIINNPVSDKGYTNLSGNYSGKSLTLGDSYTVFEPQDCDKGDIARAIFYMVARYNAYAGSNSDSFSTNEPNLELVSSAPEKSSYTSTGTNPGQMGIKEDLLEWNRLDPPDAWEIHRNNLLYKNYTNNRNPFIDFPQWADYIWGTKTSGDYAIPSSDSISTFDVVETVSVTGVSLQPSATVAIDSDVTLVPTIEPSNATNKAVTWSSSNTNVATVSAAGVVHGVAAGSTTITVTTQDGNKTDTCLVTVEEETESEETLTLSINYNDTFDPALPTSAGTVNSELTSHTDTTVNFAFDEKSIYTGSSYLMFKKSASPMICNTESLGTIESISATYSSECSESVKIGVIFGDEVLDTYSSENHDKIKGRELTDKWTNSTEGNGYFQLSTSTSNNCQITNITIKYHPCLSSITVSEPITDFFMDEEYEFGGTVTANYSDGSSKVVTSDATFSGFDMSEEGKQTVTVSYSEGNLTKTTTYEINVEEYNAIESVSLSHDSLRFDLKEDTKTSQLTATVEKVGSKATTSVTWESSDTDVATVSNSGLVTAKSVGTATITATSTYDTTMSATCAVTVVDSSVQSEEVTDVLTRATTGITGTTYSSWSGKTASSDAVYAGQSAGGNDSIQLRSSNNNSGVITTTSGGNAKTIVVSWNSNTNNSRVINIYGSTTAYSNPTELYDNSTCGTLLGTLKYGSTSFTVTGDYQYIGIRSASGALYLESISITWTTNGSGEGGGDTPPTPASNFPYADGVAYKLYVNNTNDYYFTGSKTGSGNRFGATSDDYNDGVYVYFEQDSTVEDGHNLYFKNGNTKYYICVTVGDKVNFDFQTTEPDYVWEYDDTNECIYMEINSTPYSIGTYSSYPTFSAFSLTKYPDNYKPQFQDTAESFSYYLCNKMTCDASGNTSPVFDDDYTWSKLSTLAVKLDMLDGDVDTEVNKLESANYESPTTIVDFGIQRYRYLVWKYGYTDFLNLGVTPRTEMMNHTPIAEDYTTIILIISLASISGLGLLLIRKKKHN